MHFARRRLPHLHSLGAPLFVTFRLHGSLPRERWFSNESAGEAFACMDRLLDASKCGPKYLALPEIALIVVDCVRRRALSDYLLHSWVVMPNHVHLLMTPKIALSEIIRRLKGASAREANKSLGLLGTFWQEESYDHLVRSEVEFGRIESYILENPVKAGLVRSAEEFRWSSSYDGSGPRTKSAQNVLDFARDRLPANTRAEIAASIWRSPTT